MSEQTPRTMPCFNCFMRGGKYVISRNICPLCNGLNLGLWSERCRYGCQNGILYSSQWETCIACNGLAYV